MHFHYIDLLSPPKGLNLGSRKHEFQNISKELHEHYNHAFSIFFQIYIEVEKISKINTFTRPLTLS